VYFSAFASHGPCLSLGDQQPQSYNSIHRVSLEVSRSVGFFFSKESSWRYGFVIEEIRKYHSYH
jgi:hypothetical protein